MYRCDLRRSLEMRRRSERVIKRPSLTHFCKTLVTLLLGSLSLKILLFKSSFSSSSVNSSDLPSCVPVIDSCLTASVLEEIDLNGIFWALRAFLQLKPRFHFCNKNKRWISVNSGRTRNWGEIITE